MHDAHVVRHGCNSGGCEWCNCTTPVCARARAGTRATRASSASRIRAVTKSGVCSTGTRTCSGPGPGPGPGPNGALICAASIGAGGSGEPEEIVNRLAAEIGAGLEVGAQAGAGCQGLGGGPTGGGKGHPIAPIRQRLLLHAEITDAAQGVAAGEAHTPAGCHRATAAVQNRDRAFVGTVPAAADLDLNGQIPTSGSGWAALAAPSRRSRWGARH